MSFSIPTLLLKVILAIYIFLINGCCEKTSNDLKKPFVVTTTTMIASLVRTIASPYVNIMTLMGPGVDPHFYKPSASDILYLMHADAIFYNGLMLEGRMEDALQQRSELGTCIHAITKTIPKNQLIMPAGMKEQWDPHVWFDPIIWSYCINTAVQGLSQVDPIHKEYYEKISKSVKKEYLELDYWIRSQISQLSSDSRILVTSHDAYNYFGRTYGFQVIGVQGVSTVNEAGLADIANTVNFIKKNKINAIFIESSVSSSIIKQVSIASGAKIGGELYSDALGYLNEIRLGPKGKQYLVGTLSGMIRYNVAVIIENLKKDFNFN